MAERLHKIMLVEPDAALVEALVSALSRRCRAQITCVADAQSCLDVELGEPHDLIIVDRQLEDADGLQLCDHLLTLCTRPIILLACSPTREDVLSALRRGIRDVFVKPFEIEGLLDSCERALLGFEMKRRHQLRYRRMRELVRHVICERRDLNRRIELICRDLVAAHRRLVSRVVKTEAMRTEPQR